MELSPEQLVLPSSTHSLKPSTTAAPATEHSPLSQRFNSSASFLSTSTSSSSSSSTSSPLSLPSTPSSTHSSHSTLSLPSTPPMLLLPPAPTFPCLATTCGAYLTLPRPPPLYLLSSYVDRLVLESSFPPPVDYPAVVQHEFDVLDRGVLIEYVQQSCVAFGLSGETCVWCVNLFDRFMSARSVKRPYLQLCALSCLLLAWKMTEGGGSSGAISVAALSDWTSGLYSATMIAEMELLILANLNYRLTNLSAQSALSYLIEAFGPTLPGVVQYTAEHTLTLSYALPAFICCRGSVLAVAAVLAGWSLHDRGGEGAEWLSEYQRLVGAVVDSATVSCVAAQMVRIVQAVNTRQVDGNDSDDNEDDEEAEEEDADQHADDADDDNNNNGGGDQQSEDDNEEEEEEEGEQDDNNNAVGQLSRDDLQTTDTDEAEPDEQTNKRRRLT